jgi:hypothetical protein
MLLAIKDKKFANKGANRQVVYIQILTFNCEIYITAIDEYQL